MDIGKHRGARNLRTTNVQLLEIVKRQQQLLHPTTAAATQQGGGNTQITNVTKKDGDVTHMPKSDIRNNKFAALTGSRLYPAGAI